MDYMWGLRQRKYSRMTLKMFGLRNWTDSSYTHWHGEQWEENVFGRGRNRVLWWTWFVWDTIDIQIEMSNRCQVYNQISKSRTQGLNLESVSWTYRTIRMSQSLFSSCVFCLDYSFPVSLPGFSLSLNASLPKWLPPLLIRLTLLDNV